MSIQQEAYAAIRSLVTHLMVVMVLFATGSDVHARPCFEGADLELCALKSALYDEEVFLDTREQFSDDHAEPKEGKYDYAFKIREMRDLSEEYQKNCTGCYEDTDVVDREDHITQHLSELLVNTDSEITGLQASDVEETIQELGTREDGYFAFLTGDEKILEVEGVWSGPAQTIVEASELLNYA